MAYAAAMYPKPIRPGAVGSGIAVLRGARDGRSTVLSKSGGPVFSREDSNLTVPGEGDPIDTLRSMVRQTQDAINADLLFPALMVCLALPDICGAVSAPNGRASRSKTIGWLREHGGYSQEDAALIYGFRCSLLHQGSGIPHQTDNTRIAFVAPDPHQTVSIHWMSTEHAGDDEVVFWITASLFVDEICEAVEMWIEAFGMTETVLRNLRRSVRLRPDGLSGHFHGGPVIA
jgi:hypothetical protein